MGVKGPAEIGRSKHALQSGWGVVAVKGTAGKVRYSKHCKVGGVLSVGGTWCCRNSVHTQVIRGMHVVKNPTPRFCTFSFQSPHFNLFFTCLCLFGFCVSLGGGDAVQQRRAHRVGGRRQRLHG